jgi:ADP-heptose:LPS heptosyltransferase
VKLLVARTDKLGDVVLSLPVFAYIEQKRPDWELHALVAPGSVPLLENDPHLEAVWTYKDAELAELESRLAAERFDAAILLYYHKPLAAALRRAKIPRRVGPLSKWSSWFLLNRGVWQNRSRIRHHERDYNVRLAQKLTGKGGAFPDPLIHLTAGQIQIGRQFRREEAATAESVVFVHPGSGGSALNWAPESYATVANQLAAGGDCRVFVTGGPRDSDTVQAVAGFLQPAVEVIAGRFPLRDFLGVLTAGDLLIGPSTGPLHMAAALGLAVVGLYPPIPTQSLARWGPLGTCSHGLAPDVPCPAHRICFGERCRHWNCMVDVAEREVVAAATAALRDRRRQRSGTP